MLTPIRTVDADDRAQTEIIRLDTLPDIARKLRRIMDEIGADHFAACFLTSRAERRRLLPCLDAEYPGMSEATKKLAAMVGDQFVRRISGSSLPLWWMREDVSTPALLPQQLYLAERIEPLADTPAGIALPVAVEHGQEGVLLFTGLRLHVSMDALCDVHARCIGLFGIIARLRPVSNNGCPPISKRELECLMLTANGLTSEEIADRLKLSVHTANQYLTNTTRKLNAVNRMQAVAKALRMGLFE